MPTKPQSVNIDNATSAQVLNAVRQDAGADFQAAIPRAIAPGDTLITGRKATLQDSILQLRAIGNAIDRYLPGKETFVNALVNRIGRTVITSRLYSNPIRRFKRGFLEYGESIEEIFVGMASVQEFIPVGTEEEQNPHKIFLPNINAVFHSMNFRKYYPITITNDDLRTAFLSWEGITDLIARIIEQVYTAANYDEFMVMKYMIARLALSGQIYPVVVPAVTADNARSVTTTYIKYAKDFKYMRTKYNRAGVRTYTDPSWLVLLLTAEIQSVFDVEVLALAFNMDKTTLIGRQVEIDSFGELDTARLQEIFADDPYTNYTDLTTAQITQLKSIQGLMVDERWFMIYDNYMEMTSKYNPRQLYWNYFYHVWKTFSTSPFQNAVLFTSTATTVTALTITAPTLTEGAVALKKGSQTQFTVSATGTGFTPNSVVWSVSGGDAYVSITPLGLLTIKSATTATAITVKATSQFNPSISVSATVTIS